MQWSEMIKEYIHHLDEIEVNQALLRKLVGLIDLTSLNESDTEASIASLCEKARSSLGEVAAVCVYPKFVRLVATEFSGTVIKTVTVVNFPQGKSSLESTLLEIGRALEDGAQEIDVVFPYSRYLNGEKEDAYTFVSECKAACGENVILKVILETGALADSGMIAEAAYGVLMAGADFIKTSTGKISRGATLDVVATLLLVLKRVDLPNKGLKVSGGVREIEQAAQYVALATRIMGENWVNPTHFRIGASTLINSILSQA